jgi:hypothetical protein
MEALENLFRVRNGIAHRGADVSYAEVLEHLHCAATALRWADGLRQ